MWSSNSRGGWVGCAWVECGLIWAKCGQFLGNRGHSLPLPPHIVRHQPYADRLDSTVLDLNVDRTIETEPRRGAVEPHFTVPLEHDTRTGRDGWATLERTASASIVADLLPITPGRCAVVRIRLCVLLYIHRTPPTAKGRTGHERTRTELAPTSQRKHRCQQYATEPC